MVRKELKNIYKIYCKIILMYVLFNIYIYIYKLFYFYILNNITLKKIFIKFKYINHEYCHM